MARVPKLSCPLFPHSISKLCAQHNMPGHRALSSSKLSSQPVPVGVPVGKREALYCPPHKPGGAAPGRQQVQERLATA